MTLLVCGGLAQSSRAQIGHAGRPTTAAGTDLVTGLSLAKLCDLPEGSRPVVVRAAFHLLDINKIDDEAETFGFSGVLTLTWNDSRQAFDPDKEGVNEKFYHGSFQFNELSPAWYPQVVLVNAAGTYEKQGVILRVKSDGTSTLIETFNTVARSKLELRRYPFDRQQLEAIFEILGFGASEVALELVTGAASAERPKIRVPQWNLADLSSSICSMTAPYAGAEGSSAAFVLTLDMHRQPWFMLRLVVAPLFLVVVLSWSVFWMGRSSLGDRMSISFVGILTAVAYQMVVSDIMPQISYVTLMNAFLNFSFWIMCASVVVNLVVGACDKRGNPERGERIDRRCRWIFPLVYVGLMSVASVIAFLLVRE